MASESASQGLVSSEPRVPGCVLNSGTGDTFDIILPSIKNEVAQAGNTATTSGGCGVAQGASNQDEDMSDLIRQANEFERAFFDLPEEEGDEFANEEEGDDFANDEDWLSSWVAQRTLIDHDSTMK